jgi:hypothetical protein
MLTRVSALYNFDRRVMATLALSGAGAVANAVVSPSKQISDNRLNVLAD